jgi:hypothetical protein
MAERQEASMNERCGDYSKVIENQRNKDGDKDRGEEGQLLERAMDLKGRKFQILGLFV